MEYALRSPVRLVSLRPWEAILSFERVAVVSAASRYEVLARKTVYEPRPQDGHIQSVGVQEAHCTTTCTGSRIVDRKSRLTETPVQTREQCRSEASDSSPEGHCWPKPTTTRTRSRRNSPVKERLPRTMEKQQRQSQQRQCRARPEQRLVGQGRLVHLVHLVLQLEAWRLTFGCPTA
ncbi:uncharacterized protein BP5553_00067 [Venustampulla echinocandica]|uniref:Uncharacterized protein n=1 Tax=Venustampulla echinocandica TaxID=2656787 RepID=A0A370TX80_9HELO|nr:uncharacterized protein BP5553_00067 [Venustampulla echinocandica]RDL40088.1 hypothetical protein BP5553_00067 [Venustampulla echinocandica]